MVILSNIIAITCAFIILFSAISFAKTKDIFVSLHFIIISNIYGFSLLIIFLTLGRLNLDSYIKIIALILLNIIITLIITRLVARMAYINKIIPQGEIIKLDYLSEENDQ